MEWYFVTLIFIVSCFALAWLSSSLVKSLINVAKYLRWREFVVAFFVIAFATSLPNLFVDLNAVFHNIPEVALGDIIGGNLADLTIVLGIAVFFTRKGFSADSVMVQRSAIFTTAIAVLPLFLIWDGSLDRMDGIILIAAFLFYAWWLFGEKGHFKKVYRSSERENIVGDFKGFLFHLGKVIVLLALLLLVSQAVISSAQFFSAKLAIPLGLVGILIVGLGNCFPEIYFAVVFARREENWLVLGELMGSVIVCATLVLGLVAVMSPFTIQDLSLFLAARIFLIIAAAFSLLFIFTSKKLTKKEGLFLLFIYISFLLVEIFIT